MKQEATNYLKILANKATGNEQFLGFLLTNFAADNGIEMSDVASRLKCPAGNITILSLCKVPRESAQFFHLDVRGISKYSGCDSGELANLVREYRALDAMRQFNQSDTSYESMLMAARDKKDDLKVADENDEDNDES